MTYLRFIFLSLVCVLLTACEDIAVYSTPKKQPQLSHSQLAKQAQHYFWTTLHQGHYTDIAESNRLLMAAYLQNPNDPQLAAHLGFLHIWKITERYRETPLPPTIVNEIV